MDQIAFCPKCGADWGPDVTFCPKCGARVRGESEPEAVPEARAEPDRVRIESDIRCLACGSRNVHAEKRGWKWTTGVIGSGRIVLTCLACGHQQRPGERRPGRYGRGRFRT